MKAKLLLWPAIAAFTAGFAAVAIGRHRPPREDDGAYSDDQAEHEDRPISQTVDHHATQQ